MAEHDFSLQIDKCPRCIELKSLVHDMNLPPSECRACIEFRRKRSRPSRSTHVPGFDTSVIGILGARHAARAPHTLTPPIATSARVMDNDHMVAADQTGHQASEKLRANQAAKCAIEDSWNLVIEEINRNLSPGGR